MQGPRFPNRNLEKNDAYLNLNVKNVAEMTKGAINELCVDVGPLPTRDKESQVIQTEKTKLTQSILTRLQGLENKQANLDEAENEQKREASKAENELDRIEAALDTVTGSVTEPVFSTTSNIPSVEVSSDGCQNAQIDGGESDVDCGGNVCKKCSNTKKCGENLDCTSLTCESGRCAESQWQIVSERVNLLCDIASKPVYEGASNGEDDCVSKCEAITKAQGPINCAFVSYWLATKWCRLTPTCETKSPDAHKEYQYQVCGHLSPPPTPPSQTTCAKLRDSPPLFSDVHLLDFSCACCLFVGCRLTFSRPAISVERW
jgi:hypothetical protein